MCLVHSKVTKWSDNDPAMVQTVDRTLAPLRSSGVASAFAEGSVSRDTQTHGAAERAGKLVQGMFRARRFGLERQLRTRVPLDHPVVA